MNYKMNPKNGDQLSILGFGCMRFGGTDVASSFGGRFDKQKAEDLIKSAIDRGVNYFDTAYIYSGSEEALGKTLAKYSLRKKVYIATNDRKRYHHPDITVEDMLALNKLK